MCEREKDTTDAAGASLVMTAVLALVLGGVWWWAHPPERCKYWHYPDGSISASYCGHQWRALD